MDRTPAGRAEIHFHLLPDVDDGPASMEESLELARLAVRDGTHTVVATPHVREDFFTDVHELPQRVRELNARLRLEGIPLDVMQGAEVGPVMVGTLDARGLEHVASGPSGARWILLEPPFASLAGALDAAAELRARGYTVVLAHPERSAGVLTSGCRLLRQELAAGTLAQISVSSLLGHHGSECRWRRVTSSNRDSHTSSRATRIPRGVHRRSAPAWMHCSRTAERSPKRVVWWRRDRAIWSRTVSG